MIDEQSIIGGYNIPSLFGPSDEMAHDDTPRPPVTLEECLARPTDPVETPGIAKHVMTLKEILSMDRCSNAEPVAKACYRSGWGSPEFGELALGPVDPEGGGKNRYDMIDPLTGQPY